MSYLLIRAEGPQQASAKGLDAAFAVRLMRCWAAAYPQHYLLLRDERGTAVAFRRPPSVQTGPASHSAAPPATPSHRLSA